MRIFSRWLSLYAVILGLGSALIWFSQNSINAYWQQTYHQESPLESLNQNAIWRWGGVLQEKMNKAQQVVLSWFDEQNQQWLARWGILSEQPTSEENTLLQDNAEQDVEPVLTATPPSELDIPKNVQQELGIIPVETPVSNETAAPIAPMERKVAEFNSEPKKLEKNPPLFVGSYALLYKGDKVFFAGDSLMQGVAPFVQKALRQQYGLDSINLSKQSTGLSYPSFFDWPATIEKTLNSNKNIKLLVVFLGPNDPWDFPNPAKKRGTYLRFASEEWAEVYAQRIQRILTAAQKNNVRVIWLGVPYMKAKKLNSQMDYLNGVLAQTLRKNSIWLPTRDLLSNGNAQYADSISLNGKMVAVRSKDGIHFTPTGQKLLADYILQHIQYQP